MTEFHPLKRLPLRLIEMRHHAAAGKRHAVKIGRENLREMRLLVRERLMIRRVSNTAPMLMAVNRELPLRGDPGVERRLLIRTDPERLSNMTPHPVHLFRGRVAPARHRRSGSRSRPGLSGRRRGGGVIPGPCCAIAASGSAASPKSISLRFISFVLPAFLQELDEDPVPRENDGEILISCFRANLSGSRRRGTRPDYSRVSP